MKRFYFESDHTGYVVRENPIRHKIASFVNETTAAEYCEHRNQLLDTQGDTVLIGFDMTEDEYLKMKANHSDGCPARNGAPVCRCRGEQRIA